MSSRHIRQNAVAYLALLVALSTGTAYAAGLVDGSVTTSKLAKNSVTSSKIKKNAVKSPDLKNGSVKAADLAPGVVQAPWVDALERGGTDPSSTPDGPERFSYPFTVPRAGALQIVLDAQAFYASCSAGSPQGGIYLDGVPVAGTRLTTPTTTLGSRHVVALVDVPAGPHELTFRVDCPAGTPDGGVYNDIAAWTLTLGA